MPTTESKNADSVLSEQIADILLALEKRDMLICISSINVIVDTIVAGLKENVLQLYLSVEELSAIRSLIYYASNDKRFFDWEMPTLTGYTAEQFKEIANKLPNV